MCHLLAGNLAFRYFYRLPNHYRTSACEAM